MACGRYRFRASQPIALAAAAVLCIAWEERGACQDVKPKQRSVDDEQTKEIRSLLRNARVSDVAVSRLNSMGSSAYQAYFNILRDKESGPDEISWALEIVRKQKGDRSAFLPFAAKLTQYDDWQVQLNAARLIGEIGGPADVPAVRPLLSESCNTVQYWAAEVMVKIGTADDLETFNRRLSSKRKDDTPELLEAIRKCRNQLQKRLDEENKKKK